MTNDKEYYTYPETVYGEITPRYPVSTNPARYGVYRARFYDDPNIYFSLYDHTGWHSGWYSHADAEGSGEYRLDEPTVWWGLAKDPDEIQGNTAITDIFAGYDFLDGSCKVDDTLDAQWRRIYAEAEEDVLRYEKQPWLKVLGKKIMNVFKKGAV